MIKEQKSLDAPSWGFGIPQNFQIFGLLDHKSLTVPSQGFGFGIPQNFQEFEL